MEEQHQPEQSRIRERLRITKGLGPFQADEGIDLEIRPFTVFIGAQGTGKSLVSQLLYFFRDAPYLLSRSRSQTPESSVRKVVEGIRTGDLTGRALASFLTTSTVRVHYERELKARPAAGARPPARRGMVTGASSPGVPLPGAGRLEMGISASKIDRKISINKQSRKIRPLKPFFDEIDNWFQEQFWLSAAPEFLPKAIFVPAERTFFSRFINSDPSMLGHPALPLTMHRFARVLTEAGQIFQQWQDEPSWRPSEAEEIEKWVKEALRGEVKYSQSGRYAGRWQWIPEGGDQPIEVEMASSGQMEAWPLVLTAQTLFSLERERQPLFLHIEEPEAHLHPAAQVAIVKVLAYLVNHGFNVVVTTHSLTVLYTLNNLMLASALEAEIEDEDVPGPELRLAADKVAAFVFGKDGVVRDIVDRETGFVSEAELGEVSEALSEQMNVIGALRWHLESSRAEAGK